MHHTEARSRRIPGAALLRAIVARIHGRFLPWPAARRWMPGRAGGIGTNADPGPGPDCSHLIADMDINDASADAEAGTSQRFEEMAELFRGGDITLEAWRRYCPAYRAKRFPPPQGEARAPGVPAGPPA